MVREGFYVMVSLSRYSVILTSLTEEEEDMLDKDCVIKVERNGMKFRISPDDLIAYGEIDFSTGSDDYNTIQDFAYLDHLGMLGKSVPARYNYREHCTYAEPGKRYQTYDTTDPAILAQYAHAFIGKPERSIIFKHKHE